MGGICQRCIPCEVPQSLRSPPVEEGVEWWQSGGDEKAMTNSGDNLCIRVGQYNSNYTSMDVLKLEIERHQLNMQLNMTKDQDGGKIHESRDTQRSCDSTVSRLDRVDRHEVEPEPAERRWSL
uniref:Uncharacterized protein n=2 Tax=Hemiselmis andersenii TaxID=464988 RepID=A0A6U2JI59_HEMAN|mmetsp:Transcript_9845/g.22975  ORF Transcript_9845/g.22975 Transcript_9845/m.22975 type:complete len:123 (-) Transcript_9845:195-563(-)